MVEADRDNKIYFSKNLAIKAIDNNRLQNIKKI